MFCSKLQQTTINKDAEDMKELMSHFSMLQTMIAQWQTHCPMSVSIILRAKGRSSLISKREHAPSGSVQKDLWVYAAGSYLRSVSYFLLAGSCTLTQKHVTRLCVQTKYSECTVPKQVHTCHSTQLAF